MKPPFDWIEINNQAQLEWIGQHLRRKSISGSILFNHVKNHAEFGYYEMARSLKEIPNEAEYREASGLIKGAWDTHQYRKKHGNPVSLQMPKNSLKKLNNLAKQRGETQGTTLSQIITDALDDHKSDTAQARRDRVRFKDQLNKQQELAQQIERMNEGVVDELLKALVEELSKRCQLEARMGEAWDESQLSDEKIEVYHDLVEKRVLELEPVTSRLKLRPRKFIPSLRKRMKEKGESINNSKANLDLDNLTKFL